MYLLQWTNMSWNSDEKCNGVQRKKQTERKHRAAAQKAVRVDGNNSGIDFAEWQLAMTGNHPAPSKESVETCSESRDSDDDFQDNFNGADRQMKRRRIVQWIEWLDIKFLLISWQGSTSGLNVHEDSIQVDINVNRGCFLSIECHDLIDFVHRMFLLCHMEMKSNTVATQYVIL